MKRIVNIIILAFFVFNCTYTAKNYLAYERTELIVVSERVGDTIDPQEREQFNLFQGINDFQAAYFYSVEGSGYEVEIITEHEKLRAANMNPRAIEIMQDYIDKYEEITISRQGFEKKWNIVDYDALGQPITQDEINRVKRFDHTVGCGGSCCLLGLTSLLFMNEFYETARLFGGSTNYEPYYYAIGATVAGTIAGALEGHRQDKSNALKKIKEARKPRIVE